MMGIECVVLIPFIIKFKSLDVSGKSILYYIASSVVFAGGSYVIQKLFGNNLWFFSVMNLVQFVILSIFYWHIIKNDTMRMVIKIMPVIITIIFLIDFFLIEGMQNFNSISAGARNFVIIFYGIFFFLQLLRDKDLIERAIYIDSLPSFWYNAGIFLYFCTSFMFNISYNFIIEAGMTPLMAITLVLSSIYFVGTISMILFYIGLTKEKKASYANS
ncbi:hypothetical protein [Chitinophaga vietnamensis]|uniref:hypothetical protein n=2 Tax=Chitinophaga vietnamensis TaxID=2593957 RepID=UPI0011A60AF1|nr:hypothetical protein [Chitinophaga vietnamensis]